MVLAPLRRHTDFALSSPEVQRLIAQRYPEGVPVDEPVISPVDLLVSERVVRVAETP